MPSTFPTGGHPPRAAPSPTVHPIYRSSSNTPTQQWVPSPIESLEPPPGRFTAVGSTTSTLRPVSKERSPAHTGFQRQRPKIAVIFADIVGIVLPLGFIAFAVVIIKINGTRIDPSAPYGTRTNSLGPYKDPINIFATAFPIVFAALVGRLITMFIRWKLERGAGIQFLERLLGSRSVGNTVLTLFLMPLSWITLILVLVWAFSPLGAQSILRILETRMQDVFATATTSYFDTDTTSWLASPNMIRSGLDGLILSRLAFISSMYSAALLSSNTVKASASDLWGNLKVPFVQNYETQDWQAAPANDPTTLLASTSLIGLPLINVPFGNSTFEIESSYIHLEHELSGVEVFDNSLYNATSLDSQRLGMHAGSWSLDPANGTWQGQNHIFVDQNSSAQWNIALDNFISPRWDPRSAPNMNFRPGKDDPTPYRPSYFTNMTGIEVNHTRLRLEVELPRIEDESPDHIFKAYFRVTQRYVQSRVNCSRTVARLGGDDRPICVVVENRPSQKPHAPEDISQLSFPLLFTFLTSRLPRATGIPCHFYQGRGFGVDPSLAYLVNPSIRAMLPKPGLTGKEVREIAGQISQIVALPPPVLATRLAQVLNTYLLLGQSFEVATTSTEANPSLAGMGLNVTAEVKNVEEIYHVPVEWMALYITASAVLLLGGVLATALAHSALGPDLMGYASAVLRNSKFVELETEDGKLDGVDLSNKLGKQRFRFGFVGGRTDGLEGNPLLGVAYEEKVRGLRE